MTLQGQIAVVTGGAVRLGKAIALSLADAGCTIALHYGSSANEADETLAEIRATGVRGITVQADLSEPPSAAATVFSAVNKVLGPATILINSAAIFEPGTLADTTDDEWNRHLAINLTAPFCLSREFAKQFPCGERGHLINIVDWRTTRPQAGHLAYTVAKSGLVTLTKVLAQELAPDVQVNAIAPGAILPAPGTAADEFAQLAECIPLRRTGRPDDVADAVLFLLRSEFLTGEVLHITGGQQL